MNKRALLATAVLAAAILICFGLPKPKYAGLNILPELDIPMEFGEWKARDISSRLRQEGEQYNFISDISARIYTDSKGQELLLLILDAGNFHNPKVCYGASGFVASDLADTSFRAGTRQFNAATLYLEKGETRLVLIYWLCINKKLTGWAGQKTRELFSSLLNRKKAGLMVRIDIPVSPENKKSSAELARSFIAGLSAQLSPEQNEYLFGK